MGYKECLLLWHRENVVKLQGKLRKRFGKLSGREQNKNKSRWHYQLRNVFSWNILVCLIFVGVVFLSYFNNKMNTISIAMAGENVLVFVSLFIFMPICNIERDSDIQDFVYTSNTSYAYLFFQRVALAIVLLGLFIEIPLFIMAELSHASLGRWCIGIFLSSLYIAIISMLVSELCSSSKAGILMYIGYYFLCILMGKKMLFMTICGYSNFLKYTKYQLLAGIIVGLILLGVVVYYKQLGRGELRDEN